MPASHPSSIFLLTALQAGRDPRLLHSPISSFGLVDSLLQLWYAAQATQQEVDRCEGRACTTIN
jgi:hypothetical protein